MAYHRSTAILTAILCFLSVHPLLYAATGDTVTEPESGTGFGSITIEQVTPLEGVLGDWTLLKPGNLQQESNEQTLSVENTKTGNYTIIVHPPDGAIAHVKVEMNGESLVDNEHPQATFSLATGDTASVIITYFFTRVGAVSVTSEPPGLKFSLEGPNNSELSGVTPQSYQDVPEGLYSVTYHPIEGCMAPRPISKRLQNDGRITISITVACENLEEVEQHQQQQHTLEHISTVIDGETIVFNDVPIDAWFASFVHNALKTGIVSGYRDRGGRLTGVYGPQDNVSIAQLAKVAHELAGIDETKVRVEPQNTRARETWFAQYFASAEVRGWFVFRNTRQDPARNATRAEVTATLLQALDVRRVWPKGTTFADVSFTSPYAASIETASVDGLVSGDTSGNAPIFRPEAPINRAELAKMISLAIELYGEQTQNILGESY